MVRGGAVVPAFVCAAVALLAGPAPAEEPKAQAPAAETVDLKLAAKAGDVLRFRHTESSGTEVNGAAYGGKDLVHEYSVTVKSARPDGGLEVELRFELVQGKLAGAMGAAPREFDSGKPAAADADAATKALTTMAAAQTRKPFGVTLDARGGVVAVRGLRECMMEAVRGTPFEEAFSAEKDFSDAKCVEEVAPLFCGSPSAPHAVRAAWTETRDDRVGTSDIQVTAKCAVSTADAEKAVVAAKLNWVPGPEATANGAKASGGGSSAATYSRQDGFLLAFTKDLKVSRDTGAMKAASRTTHRIERLESKPAAPPKPKSK